MNFKQNILSYTLMISSLTIVLSDLQAQEAIKVRDFDTKIELEGDDRTSKIAGKEYFFDSTLAVIYDADYDEKSKEYYEFQEILWKRLTKKDPQNGDAWLNLFRCQLYAGSDNSILESTITAMKAAIPGDYRFYFATYLYSKEPDFITEAFNKADKEGKKWLYKDYVKVTELSGNQADKNKALADWKLSGNLPDELFKFAYNLLITPSENAILITDGGFDTYPLWILQNTDNIRPDVKILNLELCKNPKYCERILKEFGLKGNPGLMNKPAEFVSNLYNQNPTKSIYISMTVIKPTLKSLAGNLNCEGLAYRIGKLNYMTVYKLVDNIENAYNTRYLTQTFSNHVFNQSAMHKLNLTYLVPLLQVYDYYKYKDNNAMALKFYDIAMVVAKKRGYEDLVMMYRFNW